MSKIYVGNLPFETEEDQLRELFARFGPIDEATVIRDRDTGRSRGFGFVQMSEEAARQAIAELNGQPFGGRTLRVSEAHERTPRRNVG